MAPTIEDKLALELNVPFTFSETTKKGGLFSKPKPAYTIAASGVANDITFGATAEAILRKEFGMGTFEKEYNPDTYEFSAVYTPMRKVGPVRTVSESQTGLARTEYATPGSER